MESIVDCSKAVGGGTDSPQRRSMSAMASRVENRRSGFSLPVAVGVLSHGPPQSGLTWLCFLFPLIEPDRQISRIRLSEKSRLFGSITEGVPIRTENRIQ